MTEQIQLSAIVPEEMSGMRLDQVLANLFQQHSRTRLQNWIKQGNVLVNDAQVSQRHKVSGGEYIHIVTQWQEQSEYEAEDIALDVLFEDEAILIINKPPGLVTHPGAGNQTGTLLNALLHHCPDLNLIPRAGIVHRLDKDTSGVMVIAKTPEIHTSLIAMMQNRLIRREYLALVKGKITSGGTIDQPIGRHPKHRTQMAVVPSGKQAITHYRIQKRYQDFTLLKCQLETGRTHQIRVHTAFIRHPIIGDPVYGGRFSLPKGCSDRLKDVLQNFRRQALHAYHLSFPHPVTQQAVEWQAHLPDDFKALLDILDREQLA